MSSHSQSTGTGRKSAQIGTQRRAVCLTKRPNSGAHAPCGYGNSTKGCRTSGHRNPLILERASESPANCETYDQTCQRLVFAALPIVLVFMCSYVSCGTCPFVCPCCPSSFVFACHCPCTPLPVSSVCLFWVLTSYSLPCWAIG